MIAFLYNYLEDGRKTGRAVDGHEDPRSNGPVAEFGLFLPLREEPVVAARLIKKVLENNRQVRISGIRILGSDIYITGNTP